MSEMTQVERDEDRTVSETVALAKRIRLDVLKMLSRGRGAHVGAVFSMVDIVAVLYGAVLRVDPTAPGLPDRDRFILSKGHAGAGIYACLAECGFFPRAKLLTHYADGSDLSGHVSHKGIPGVDLSTGSLGHGLSVAAGMALGAKRDAQGHRVFALLSDGECDEGSTWEAVLFAPLHRLDNLVAVVDYNRIQSLASTADTLELEPFADKWHAFGWAVREVAGHDHAALLAVFRDIPAETGRPTCVIAHTTKGRGVSFMENQVLWHYRTPVGEEYEAALRELEADE
jgi:transketolase